MRVKVLAAMSGGVDSSVCAQLLLEAGYDCIGATMRLNGNADGDIGDAAAVCRRLGIEHRVFDLRERFEDEVVRRFIGSYERGETPNPCIECNSRLKFGVLLEKARELGCTHIATGHYARISRSDVTGRWLLKKAARPEKDQSYVLYRLTQEQLAHTLFPLGGLTKDEVRGIAERCGFENAAKRDSQDICFVPDGDYASFIKRHTGREYPAGDFVDTAGRRLGRHSGIINYTIGQRRGLGIALGERAYVCGIDADANTVTLGSNDDLFTDRLRIARLSLIDEERFASTFKARVKIRYSHTEQEAAVFMTDRDLIEIYFDRRQRAVTAGQSAVIYDGDTVLGGGVIIGR